MKAPPPQQPPAGGANASANGAPPPPHVNAHARPFHPQQQHAPHHPHHHHAPHPGHFASPYAPPQFPYGPPHGADGGPPPRGAPYHQEFRPKGGAPQEFQEQTNLPDGAADMPPSPFKPGAGMPLQPHARPFPGQPFIPGGHNGPMHGGMPPNMGGPPHMRGPPGPHGYQRMRGPPRGAPGGMPGQNYSGPRGGMNPRGQPYYMQQQQMYPGAYGMPPPGVPAPYMGAGGPMPGYPAPGMGMGMNHMPPPHAHTAHAAPPPQQREKKVLLIVDPKSGKAINATAAASTASSTPASSTAPSTPSKPTEVTESPAKQPAQVTPKKPVVEEAPKPASPTKKPSKPVGGTPGAGEEMLAKAKALLAAKADAKPKADSTPTPVAEKAPASSATPAPAPSSPKKTTKKPEASDKKPEAPAKKPEAPAASPPSPKKTAPVSPKKKTPATTPVASPVATKTKVLSPKKAASPLKKEVKTEPKVEGKAASVVEVKPVGESVNSVTIKENGKFTYTLDALLTFREMYTDLPDDAKEGDLKWPAMDVTTDGTVRARNARSGGGGGGGGGPGWDRGNEKPGLNRQSSRSSNGGGGQWQRSQDVPKRGRGERGGRGGGRGGRGAPEPLFDGPVKPLERTDNRWIPVKAESNLEAAKKKVQSIMNKMTREKFDKLAAQITEINMDSLEMLQSVIKLLFDKALGEPHFCDMYADLCVHLDQNWKVWSFLKIVQNDDDKKFYWTTMAESDSEVVGPFDGVTDALDSAASDEFEPTPAPEGLTLHEVRVREGKFIKIWARDQSNGDREYYWSGQLLEDLGDEQVLNGPFESHDLASRLAIKTCSFKRILLNACQEEFEKDNIYEELDEKFKKDKEEGSLTQEAIADYEEKRIITKARMLGNIRFIGELFRKGMLQERIMHECIMKLMGVKPTSEGLIEPSNPNNAPDEESIESLCKLLSTMGKDLDVKSSAALNMYFAYLERKMVKDKRLSSRIIFMIRDTIDLRANKWQPRRKELQSKSLNEIRKEAEREQRAPPASAPSGGGGGRPDSFRMDSRRSNSSRDGSFSQRSTMPPVYSSQSMNSRSGNVKQMTLPLDRRGLQRDDSVKTGPQGRPASFGSANPRRAPASAGPTLGKKTPSSRSGPPTPKNGAKDADRSASPVVAALSDDDKEKIAKKAKSIAEEYVSIVDLAEADACYVELLKEFKSHTDVHSVVATEILKLAIEAKVDVQRAMFDLLEKLSVEKNSLSYPGIRAGIKETLELGNDLWCDVPKLHEHLAGFIVRFAKVSEKSGVTLDWLMCGCVESLEADIYEELIQGGFLTEVCGCVLKMLKDVSVEKANAQVRNTQVTLLSLFPDYKQTPKDFKQWIDKHAIGDALALQPAVEFALHWIESKDMEETVEWYQRTVPQDVQKDPVFSTLACLFVVGSVKKGSLPSDAEGMLLNGLCVSVESQTRFVAGLFQTIGAVPDEADNFKKLLKHLVKVERAIPGIALSKWLELKNDNSVGRKRALAAFGDFVEELSKTK